ncbi:hypothetical protein C8J57DRAFT_1212018 [Mycena rebaudengoi]|nr:hypothetical protein C8J57DRAFT_1212018 [Mycena rebaudengoi]
MSKLSPVNSRLAVFNVLFNLHIYILRVILCTDLAMMPIELKTQLKLATLNVPTSRCNGRRPFLYCRSIGAIFFRTLRKNIVTPFPWLISPARAPAVYTTCPSGASGHMSERRVHEQRGSNVVCARGVSTMARKHSSVGSTPEMKPACVSGMSSTGSRQSGKERRCNTL